MKKNGSLKIEKEFKFLVDQDKLRGVPLFSSEEIHQGYLSKKGDSIELRIRNIDNKKFFQTFKKGKGFERIEIESDISREQFDKMWELTEGRRIKKYRLAVPLEKKKGFINGEINIFKGIHEGLVILEIEVEKREDLDDVILPDWVGMDVTEDPRYSNLGLACEGMPE